MTQLKYFGKCLLALAILLSFLQGCKKESEPNCHSKVIYDPNFVLFPKTGGLWVHEYRIANALDTAIIDTFTIGVPANKLVYTMPYGDYIASAETEASTPNVKLFYPLIRKKTYSDSMGYIFSTTIDTVFWIREDIESKRVYRTLSSEVSFDNTKLFEMVYMDYDLNNGDEIRTYSWYLGGNYELTGFRINSYDSLYFNKRYLRRYFTQMSSDKVIQGFDIAFGRLDPQNYSMKRKKIFIYNNDSIVQNYY